ncbi:MAG: lysylphosphatidylglycerol synthase transmembrane domain-containing protein [bacterium]
MNRRLILNVLIALIAGISVILLINSAFKEKIFLKDLLSNISLEILFVGFILNAISFLLDGFKLTIVLRALNQDISYWDSIEACIIYSFFSAITPSAMGGQPLQIYFLTKKGVKSEVATNIILLRTFEYLLLILIIDLYSVVFVLPRLPQEVIGKTLIIGGFVTSSISTFFTWFAMSNPEIFKLFIVYFKKISVLKIFIEKWEKKAYQWIDELKLSVNELWGKHKGLLIFDFSLMFIIIVLYSYLFFLPIVSLTRLHMRFLRFFGIHTMLSTFATYVPTPGASGGIEAILFASFKNFVDSSQNLLVAITLFRIITYYAVLLVGILVVLKSGTGRTDR